ncbi:unnamed protein product [Acanthoscelides obtectus]|nr:unnamed protein product [Acanthoscelides obtectus]CAK1647326.1 hypothetical protein AOBTE_LOCUS15182 [Acanthoscelides obtectus]
MKAIRKLHRDKYIVLVLTPDHLLIKWHYHLTLDGEFTVKVISKNDDARALMESNKIAILLPFSNIRAAKSLLDYDYSIVVVDHLDEVAKKLILRNIFGGFNIGLTEQNFYLKPDQKLQWSMLNWANPGCVGKLADFYDIDNDNFANFRNNYRFWWLRLTWCSCDSFERKTDDEIENYNKLLANWASSKKLLVYQNQDKKNIKRCKASEDDKKTDENDADNQRKAKGTEKSRLKKINISENSIDCAFRRKSVKGNNLDILLHTTTLEKENEASQPGSGNIYSNEHARIENKSDISCSQSSQKFSTFVSENQRSEYVERNQPKCTDHLQDIESIQKIKSESVCMYKEPILSFLMDIDETEQNSNTHNVSTEHCEREISLDEHNDDDHRFFRSIINDTGSETTSVVQQDSDLFYKKEEILSQIYDTDVKTLDNGNDFFSNFIDS